MPEWKSIPEFCLKKKKGGGRWEGGKIQPTKPTNHKKNPKCQKPPQTSVIKLVLRVNWTNSSEHLCVDRLSHWHHISSLADGSCASKLHPTLHVTITACPVGDNSLGVIKIREATMAHWYWVCLGVHDMTLTWHASPNSFVLDSDF